MKKIINTILKRENIMLRSFIAIIIGILLGIIFPNMVDNFDTAIFIYMAIFKIVVMPVLFILIFINIIKTMRRIRKISLELLIFYISIYLIVFFILFMLFYLMFYDKNNVPLTLESIYTNFLTLGSPKLISILVNIDKISLTIGKVGIILSFILGFVVSLNRRVSAFTIYSCRKINILVLRIFSYIMEFIPILIFPIMIDSIVINHNVILFTIIKYIFMTYIVGIILFLLLILIVSLFTDLKLSNLISNYMDIAIISKKKDIILKPLLSTILVKEFNVNKDLAEKNLSNSLLIYKCGRLLFFTSVLMTIINIYQIELTLNMMIVIISLLLILSVISKRVSRGNTILGITIITALGVSTNIIGVMIIFFDGIITSISTPLNILGNVTNIILIDRYEKYLLKLKIKNKININIEE